MAFLRACLCLLVLGVPLGAPASAAERIVSLGGSVTEILYALGIEDRIVAVDTTSLYPAEATELPQVGYLRQLSAEPILGLEPDLVIGTTDAGPPPVLEQIGSVGTRVVLVEDLPTPEGTVAKIRAVAEAVGEAEKGNALADSVAAEFAALEERLGSLTERPRVLFLLTASGTAPLAAGSETAAQGIIELAGGQNAIVGYSSYKPLSPEAAATLDPDLLLISDHGLAGLGGMEGLAARPDLGLMPAVQDGRVMVMETNLLLGFGPRAPQAAELLARRLHPTLLGQKDSGAQ